MFWNAMRYILEEELQIIACGINDLLPRLRKKSLWRLLNKIFCLSCTTFPWKLPHGATAGRLGQRGLESSWNAIERSMDQWRVQIGEENMS